MSMILKRIVVGALSTNCYLFGSSETRETVIIDPGGNSDQIINFASELELNPIAVLLTHGHFDHTLKVNKILSHFRVPLMYNEKEYTSRTFTQKKADKWINESDSLSLGEIRLNVLETPGHSPGSLCFYSSDVKEYEGKNIDGVLFSGDLIFRRSIGRSDFQGGNQTLLFSSIREKIMHNPSITDNFLIFPGHMGPTSVGEERKLNMFRQYFI